MTAEEVRAEDTHKLALLWANLIRAGELAELPRTEDRFIWDADLGAWTGA